MYTPIAAASVIPIHEWALLLVLGVQVLMAPSQARHVVVIVEDADAAAGHLAPCGIALVVALALVLLLLALLVLIVTRVAVRLLKILFQIIGLGDRRHAGTEPSDVEQLSPQRLLTSVLSQYRTTRSIYLPH